MLMLASANYLQEKTDLPLWKKLSKKDLSLSKIGALSFMLTNPLKLLKKLIAQPMDSKSEKSSHNLIWFQDQTNWENLFMEMINLKNLKNHMELKITKKPKLNGTVLKTNGLISVRLIPPWKNNSLSLNALWKSKVTMFKT